MKKTLVFSLVGVVAIGVLSLAVVGPRHANLGVRPAVARGGPAPIQRGYVVLPVAMRAHPLWAEVLETDRAIERNQGRLRSAIVESRPSSRGHSAPAPESSSVGEQVEELSARLNRSRVEQGAYVAPLPSDDLSSRRVLLGAHEDVAAKSKELMTHAQDLISQDARAGEQAYDDYKMRLDAEYGPKMLTLRVKRCAARSQEDIAAIDSDLSRYSTEKDALLEAKAKEIRAASDRYSGNVMSEVRSELDRFSTERYGRAQDQLSVAAAAQSRVLSAKTIGVEFPEISTIDADASSDRSQVVLGVREEAVRGRERELRQRRAELLVAVRDEVTRAAQRAAKRRGVVVTFVNERPSSVSTSADLTKDVVELVK